MRISDWSSDVCSSDLTPIASVTALHPKASKVTREQPFRAELLLNQAITGQGSDKDIRHLEISLEGSGLSYQPGDALGVWPTQSAALVDQVMAILNLSPDESVTVGNATRSLKEWLSQQIGKAHV